MIKLPPDETTPLTGDGNDDIKSSTSARPTQRGPIYVFPGVSSYRAQHQNFLHFQWCLGITFILIFLSALFIVLSLLSANRLPSSSNVALLADTSNHANSSEMDIEINGNGDDDSHTDELLLAKQMAFMKKPLPDEPVDGWALKRWHMNVTDGNQAINVGIKALGDREMLEEGLQPESVHTPAFRHYRSLNSNPDSRKLGRRGYVENKATKYIADMFNYTRNMDQRSSIGRGPKITIPDPTSNVTCNFNAKYRRSNGICNNKQHPRSYGAALIPYRRMVNPDYADGISAPRGFYFLPSARNISIKIHRSIYDIDSNFTVMLAVFGQFLDHDITATSITTSQEGESINCCLKPNQNHPECFPVIILPDDPYYSKYNITCMNFVRSAPAPTGHFGPRQQLNQATSFIDGSVIYGNSEYRQGHLRTMANGTLRMYKTDDGREILPLSTDFEDGCNRVQMAVEGKYCFESGDDRANENLLLTSMHLLWARHHNYIARGLQAENPHWDDEIIFQEARKIVAAQLAHITYNEFLPILFGREMAKEKNLLPQSDNLESPDTYDHNVNPTLANDFAAAAFRFAHTLLPGLFNMTRDNSTPEAIELHKMLFNPFSLWHNEGIDNALLGACNTPIQRVDRFFSTEITEKLFEGLPEDQKPICGLDLVSLNIQRGRDHGLPAYSVYRRHCKLSPVDIWEDMANVYDADTLASIKEIYKSPHDVDIYTGALSETPLPGALLGPLLACIISDQFLRLKLGDSHWYERKVGPQKFTKDQLREIYKTTLSQVICQNSDNIEKIRKYVMEHRPNEENIIVNCSDIKSFNFMPWISQENSTQMFKVSLSTMETNVRVFQNPSNSSNQNIELEI